MSNKNILIVEDESIVAMEIDSYLSRCNYNVVGICSNGDDAYEMALNLDVDLILMDIFLLNSNGIETAIKIKEKKGDMPIVFLTAYMDEETIDKAVATNPVAYLIKPFNRQELLASIKIGLQNKNRLYSNRVGDIYMNDEFSFDSHTSQLICCGEVVHLTKQERHLLIFFIENKNRLISNDMIEYKIWPDKPSNDSRRRSLLSRLRSKLKHKFIETISSEGYVLKI